MQSRSAPTRKLADFPQNFHVEVIPDSQFIMVPKYNLEQREYLPVGWGKPPTIPSDLVLVMESPSLPVFGILISSMHMAWLKCIGGRFGASYRYSVGLVYNTFPMPDLTESQFDRVSQFAKDILEVRASHKNANLAKLYDPDTMPANLKKAHKSLDRTVERLYRKSAFESDFERAEHLLKLFEKLTTPLTANK